MPKLLTLVAILLIGSVVGCGAPPPAPHTVLELADDPELLQGILARCKADPRAGAHDIECVNARAAVERVAAAREPELAVERGAEFERQREQRRLQEDQRRRAAERTQTGFDPYSSPVADERSHEPTRP